MRLTSACLAIGLTGFLAASLPALAGDLSNGAPGGIRDYGSGGVPVPAPITYQENFKWYVRGDIGTAFKNNGTIGNDGWPIAFSQPGEWRELSIISAGFGRYLTPSLRAEFSFDYRPERKLASGSQTISGIERSGPLAAGSVTVGLSTSPTNRFATNYYTGNLNEDISYSNSTFFASAFYDFNRDGRLRPYLGAGIGLAMHQVQRNSNDTYTCSYGTVTTTPELPIMPQTTTAAQGCDTSTTSGLQSSYSTASNNKSIGWGLAAQLSAGLTYDITPRTHWDTGYRFVWQSGHLNVASANGLSTIRIQDQTNHEIRTGVRWDLW